MSLFERIQNKLLVEQSTDDKKQTKNKNLKKDISQRRTAQDRQQQLFSRQYDAYDDGDLGNPSQSKAQTTQKTPSKNRARRKGVDYFFDAEKAKKEREAFQQGRKAYTDSKSGIKAGKVTDKGVIDYITKARNMKQGTNANTKANREAAKVIAKSSGSEYKEKIRTKYETDKDLPRRRGKNQPSYAEIKKGIDAKNPVKPGQFTGKPVPANTPVKKIKTKVTDKEIQDVIKKGRKTKPGRTKKITVGSLDARDRAIKDLDDLIIEPKSGDAAKTKKLLKKQQRIITKKITTPSAKEIEQSQKILDKVQTKSKGFKPKIAKPLLNTPIKDPWFTGKLDYPDASNVSTSKPKVTKPKVTKVKGNLFDPTGKLADQTKKAKQSFNQFMSKLKTKYPKPKLSLYDPLKKKIPNLEPLKPLKTFVKPSITKTATKSKGLLPKLLSAVRKKPKGALGVGLLAVGAYGAIKNRTKTKTPAPNKNKLLPGGLGNRETVIDPLDVTYKIVGNKNR